MKLAYRDIEGFVNNPLKAARVILVFGPDAGLVGERSAIIGKTVVSDLNDPFNVAVLTPSLLIDDQARLFDEANALSLMGGDRLIRIESADDKITTLLKAYLEKPSMHSLVLVSAGELGTKSTLRALCEKAKNAAAVPCYIEDEKDLTRFIRQVFQSENKLIDQDAIYWLIANISGDRRKVRSELDKIITYKGNEKSAVSLQDVSEICGEAGAQSFDDLVYSVASRNSASALKAYNTLSGEGVVFVSILRALQAHFRKLHIVRSHMLEGRSYDEAVKFLTPPIFFKREAAFRSQIQFWSLNSLNQILVRLMELEAQCKQTAIPVETLCAQAILSLSKMRS